MKAMIFAAGLGTRLRPLTENKPKALVEAGGISLLERAIRQLIQFGSKDIIINIHHFGEQIVQFLEEKENFGINIGISDERDLLLETGGGLKKAGWFFDEGPFLVCNADVLTDIDLKAFYENHVQSGALATLAVRKRKSSRYLLFNQKKILTGWRNAKTGAIRFCRDSGIVSDFAFSGIHAISPKIFELMPDSAVFSIIDVYLKAGRRYDIRAYPHDEDFWLDVGKLDALDEAEKWIDGQ